MCVCEAGGMVCLNEFLVFFNFACTVTAAAVSTVAGVTRAIAA